METNCFETFTQYDEKFKELVKLGYNKSSCPMFALITAHDFLEKPNEIGNSVHEKAVDLGAINYLLSGAEGMITFDQMLTYTNLNAGNVLGTSVQLVVEDVIGFSQMFNQAVSDPYSVIFLKNAKFFVVNVRPDGYCVRDCHELFQYNFTKREDLIEHLTKNYNFCEAIQIEGFKSAELDEFNNIEFLVINKSFEIKLDMSYIVNGVNDKQYVDKTDDVEELLMEESVDELSEYEEDELEIDL